MTLYYAVTNEPVTAEQFLELFGTKPPAHVVAIRALATQHFGAPCESTLRHVGRRGVWVLTLDVGELSLTWTAKTRRAVLADALDLLQRMTVAT